MHIPDGFIDAGTSLAAGGAAAAVVTFSARRSTEELEERAAPLAGIVAAFVFAAQMFNFPVAAGTSGHLIGAALAAILLGPWGAVLSVSVVVVVQALFADGGLTAIGLNVLNLAVIGCLGGYVAFRLFCVLLPPGRRSIVLAAGFAAGLSVLLTALAFAMEFAVGGTAPISFRVLAGAMLGVHGLVALVEGVATAMTVGSLLAIRPDLVCGARDLNPGTAPIRAVRGEYA